MVSVASRVDPERFTSMVNSRPMGPWPSTTTTSSGLRIQLHHALETGIDGLDEAGAIERNALRDFFHAAPDDPVHDANVLRKSAAGRLISRRYADLFINRALGVQFVAAVEAFQARNMVEDDHAVAGRVIADACADGCHHAGGFMAENARRGEQIVFDFLEIGVADAAAFHANQQLAGADGRASGLRLHRDFAVAGVDGGLHGGWGGDEFRIECRQ